MTYEEIQYDVSIVGAGPAGLSAAIRLKQLSPDISVCIIEKGAEVGSHILSGAILEPNSLTELFPNWKEMECSCPNKSTKRRLFILNKKALFKLPSLLLPEDMKNDNNYIISLGNLCKWLAVQAEGLGLIFFRVLLLKKLYMIIMIM